MRRLLTAAGDDLPKEEGLLAIEVPAPVDTPGFLPNAKKIHVAVWAASVLP
jgi:hypothetical protein